MQLIKSVTTLIEVSLSRSEKALYLYNNVRLGRRESTQAKRIRVFFGLIARTLSLSRPA